MCRILKCLQKSEMFREIPEMFYAKNDEVGSKDAKFCNFFREQKSEKIRRILAEVLRSERCKSM